MRIRPNTRFLIAALVALLTVPALAPGALAGKDRGIDISRFQGKEVEWGKIARSGVDFAFVQASRGSGKDCAVSPDRCGKDETYDRNYKLARKEGVRVGPYHRAFTDGKSVADAKKDAKREAKIFIKEVGDLKKDDLRPVLDWESPFDRFGEKELLKWIRTWLDRVEREYDVKPIIYTNFTSWQAVGDTTEFAEDGYPLWVANFNVKKPKVPADNWDGRGWAIWQFTSSGKVPGIDGDVDENKLRVPYRKITVGA